MTRSAAISDFEFLKPAQVLNRHLLYLYREGSGLFRAAVRQKMTNHALANGRSLGGITTYGALTSLNTSTSGISNGFSAPEIGEAGESAHLADGESQEREEILASLYMTIAEPSLFDETLTICDLGQKQRIPVPLDDIEKALFLISRTAAEQSLCLLVPAEHDLVKTDAWRAAVEAIGLVEERMVTVENYLEVARAYFPQSRLGNQTQLSENRRFLSRLRKFVEDAPCTPFALSMRIDIIVLTEMEHGEFREIEDTVTVRRDRLVLPETLRRFLHNRDGASLSAFMLMVDRLRFNVMLEPREILTRLYRATQGTLESRDRRYRKVEDPTHCIWAALLLGQENSVLRGNPFVAMDELCQRFASAAATPSWFSSHQAWQALVPLLNSRDVQSTRLDQARYGMQCALKSRLEKMNVDDLSWFRKLIDPTKVDAGALENGSRKLELPR
ncbi:hypothetical protein IVB41_08210 [Bradyrhizobium sp. 44]|uniref:hypothetical protein n=1 Tax=Bradyrhizobium sp. 44 TaxID=2782675 RepID=UPI001FF9510E|nr:hypothetical protein [Bradyrhizobium sp. 44]MCK1283920.1 hypothetical protein [Bradyrhizobium sp. 44]